MINYKFLIKNGDNQTNAQNFLCIHNEYYCMNFFFFSLNSQDHMNVTILFY